MSVAPDTMSAPALEDRGLERQVEERVNSGLLDHWYVVARSSDIARGGIVAVRALGRELVVWRSESGHGGGAPAVSVHRVVAVQLRLRSR